MIKTFADGETQRVYTEGQSRRMTIANAQKRTIPPTHPGAMLREDFLPDYTLTAASLANELGESRQTIGELLQEQCAISSIMALKLSRLFGNSPEFWLSAQHARDIWELEQQYRDELAQIEPLPQCTAER